MIVKWARLFVNEKWAALFTKWGVHESVQFEHPSGRVRTYIRLLNYLIVVYTYGMHARIHIRLWADKFEIGEKEVVEICESLLRRPQRLTGRWGRRACGCGHPQIPFICQQCNSWFSLTIYSFCRDKFYIIAVFVFCYLNCFLINGRYS